MLRSPPPHKTKVPSEKTTLWGPWLSVREDSQTLRRLDNWPPLIACKKDKPAKRFPRRTRRTPVFWKYVADSARAARLTHRKCVMPARSAVSTPVPHGGSAAALTTGAFARSLERPRLPHPSICITGAPLP